MIESHYLIVDCSIVGIKGKLKWDVYMSKQSLYLHRITPTTTVIECSVCDWCHVTY